MLILCSKSVSYTHLEKIDYRCYKDCSGAANIEKHVNHYSRPIYFLLTVYIKTLSTWPGGGYIRDFGRSWKRIIFRGSEVKNKKKMLSKIIVFHFVIIYFGP